MQKAFRLHVGPEFHPVGGQGIVILRFIQTGAGIHALGPVALQNLVKLVYDHILLRFFCCVFPCLLGGGNFFVVATHLFGTLAIISLVGLLYPLQSQLLGRPIRGADFVSAFEGHMLKHVRQARLALRVLCVPRIHVGKERNHRSFMTFTNHYSQSVGQLLYGYALFERSHVLGSKRSRQANEERENQEKTFHNTSRRTREFKVSIQST